LNSKISSINHFLVFLEASFAGLKSPAYAHFDITLDRLTGDNGQPKELIFVFTCKTDPTGHSSHRCSHKKTSSGTGNLVAGMTACLKHQGLDLNTVSAPKVPYSPENHRTLIALRCAGNMWPYNSVQDPLNVTEVQMLRSGTKLPDPTTVRAPSDTRIRLYSQFDAGDISPR
jgi:hypothetical protein